MKTSPNSKDVISASWTQQNPSSPRAQMGRACGQAASGVTLQLDGLWGVEVAGPTGWGQHHGE